MPYKVTWKPNYVSFDYFGIVTSQDIIQSNQEVYGDERFDKLHWQLVSFDETESVQFEPANIRLIAYMDQAAARSNPKITVAFVGKTKILEEVATAYAETNIEPVWSIIQFDSREEAVSYINQDEA